MEDSAVGAGHAEQGQGAAGQAGILQDGRSQPQLAHNRHAMAPCGLEVGHEARHAGAHHHQVGVDEVGPVVVAIDAAGARHRRRVGAQIGTDHLGHAQVQQQTRGLLAGAGHAHHQGAAHPAQGGEIQRCRRDSFHRILTVDRATRASRMLMIQKRTMILGSLQPSFS